MPGCTRRSFEVFGVLYRVELHRRVEVREQMIKSPNRIRYGAFPGAKNVGDRGPGSNPGRSAANCVRTTREIRSREEAKMIGMTPAMFTFRGRYVVPPCSSCARPAAWRR
jgi:hypothetical protein